MRTDFFCYMPADEYFFVANGALALDTTSRIGLTSKQDVNFPAFDFAESGKGFQHTWSSLGSVPQLKANDEQRFILMTDGNVYYGHALSEGSLEMTLRYTPRTEFLLGA
jgi:hypothetical protein